MDRIRLKISVELIVKGNLLPLTDEEQSNIVDTASGKPALDIESSVSFENPDDRDDEMHSTIEMWVRDFVNGVTEAATSEAFQE